MNHPLSLSKESENIDQLITDLNPNTNKVLTAPPAQSEMSPQIEKSLLGNDEEISSFKSIPVDHIPTNIQNPSQPKQAGITGKKLRSPTAKQNPKTQPVASLAAAPSNIKNVKSSGYGAGGVSKSQSSRSLN